MRYALAAMAMVVAFSLPVAAQQGGYVAPGAYPARPEPSFAREYLSRSVAFGLFQRVSSEFVMREPSVGIGVQRFAEMLVSDHGALSSELREAANQLGIRLGVPVMSDRQQEMVDLLRMASGRMRAQMFLTQQLSAHRNALALHRDYARNGEIPALRLLARSAALIEEDHLQAAERLALER